MRTSLKANADIGKLNLLKLNVTWKHQNKVKIGNACIKISDRNKIKPLFN